MIVQMSPASHFLASSHLWFILIKISKIIYNKFFAHYEACAAIGFAKFYVDRMDKGLFHYYIGTWQWSFSSLI